MGESKTVFLNAQPKGMYAELSEVEEKKSMDLFTRHLVFRSHVLKSLLSAFFLGLLVCDGLGKKGLAWETVQNIHFAVVWDDAKSWLTMKNNWRKAECRFCSYPDYPVVLSCAIVSFGRRNEEANYTILPFWPIHSGAQDISCWGLMRIHLQLRARRALSIFKDVLLRTRRALSP